MKLKKYLAKGLTLGIIIGNLPLYSFATNIENEYYNTLSNIETKEDLQKSAQKAVSEGKIDTWLEGFASIPTPRFNLTSSVLDGKIYVIGGEDENFYTSNKLEVYDPSTNSWETKSDMPTYRTDLTSSVVNGKIYVIGGRSSASSYLNTVEVYNPVTDSWETKTSMPTARYGLTSSVVDNKIYCIGGANDSYLNKVEVYNPVTDSWETKTAMSTSKAYSTSNVIDEKIYVFGGFEGFSAFNTVECYNSLTDKWENKNPMSIERANSTSILVDGKIYLIGGWDGYFALDTVEVYDPAIDTWESKTSMPMLRREMTSALVGEKIYVIGGLDNDWGIYNTTEVYVAKEPYVEEPSLEDQAISAVEKAESTKEPTDIEVARELVNNLEEGELKTELENRLDAIIPNLYLTPLNNTSSVDVYITTENILSMTLDTNTITFEDFSGIEDMDKPNAINVTVSSSLPYQLNAYLPVEIQNADKSKIMDKSILNIKENSELVYQSFTTLNTKLVLKDNCVAGDDLHHGIDLKLKQGIAHEKDVYKATIKLEVEQK